MFVVVGLVGAVLLVAFLLLDDVLEGILPDADWISGPALGAFLAAFGLFGWVGQEAFDLPDRARPRPSASPAASRSAGSPTGCPRRC